MKVDIKGGKLSIDLSELADSLDDASRRDLARHLVARVELFAAVLDAMATGEYFADGGSSGEDGAWWFDRPRMLELREKLVPLMPQLARDAVVEALRQRDSAKDDYDRMWRWAWSLFHAWPVDLRHKCPAIPDWLPRADPSAAEVDALLAGQVSP